MNASSYQQSILRPRWVEATKRSLDERNGIPAVLRQMQPLSDWEMLRGAPSGRVEDELRNALQIAASEYDNPLVRTCLLRALEVVSAGAEDYRWNSWWSVSRNVDHGRFISTGEFARAWLEDRKLNNSLLVEASGEILKGALEERPTWSELAQCEYVDGVQLLILSGDLAAASQHLSIKKTFNRVQRYFDWNVRFLEMLPSASRESLLAHLDAFFDEVRDPAFPPPRELRGANIVFGVPLLRLRLALIRWIYIEQQSVAGNWRHIIGQIGY